MNIDKKFRRARVWSNDQLRQFAPLFTGDVVNVSGADDIDKQSSIYSEYFCNAESYSLTNYSGQSYRGFRGRTDEIELDLASDLPPDLSGKFDVVFNHTTIEHIYETRKAFRNICKMSRDIVIIIVPFAQVQHENEGYLDYWRFTPACMRKMFHDEGLKVVYEAANNEFNTSVYLFLMASRQPERWSGKFPQYVPINEAGSWVGCEPTLGVAWRILVEAILRRLRRR